MIKRLSVAALSLSAAALVGIAIHEGYTDEAIIPTRNDRPTVGFGSTFREDGSPVQMGDRITPPKALARALTDIQKFEGALKRCVKVPLHQHEYDAWTQFIYNVGPEAFCNSTAVKKLNAGDYEGACNEMSKWVYAGGKRLRGLVIRREKERRLCLGYK